MTKKHKKFTKRRPQTNKYGKWLGLLALVFVVSVAAISVYTRVASRPSAGDALLSDRISVDRAYQMYQEGAFLLDVRSSEEWNGYHVPNTTLIPLEELESRLGELPVDRDIVVVCRSGNRSQTGRDILLRAGFERVTSMEGGLVAWGAAGYPLVRTP